MGAAVRGFARQDKAADGNGVSLDARTSSYHVHPRGRIQDALEAAARDPRQQDRLRSRRHLSASREAQALVWFNARHDGITLEAVGEVILTASNPEIADSRAPSYPAVVNHVVYFGDGVSRKTVLRGFKITGAKNFTTGSGDKSPIESDELRKTAFFYTDGGGIKIYARSYPTIEHVEVYENYASPVRRRRLGRAPWANAGLRALPPLHLPQQRHADDRRRDRSAARQLGHYRELPLRGQCPNMGVDFVGLLTGGEYLPEHGSGALTVFDGSRATVSRSTFTGNWSGVDDDGKGSTYVETIFWKNTLGGGISPGSRYELDITDGAGVRGSFIHGASTISGGPSTVTRTRSIPRSAFRRAIRLRRRRSTPAWDIGR